MGVDCQAYEEALRLRQDNPVLQSKLGEAFVAAHDYRAAVDYYEKALLRDPSNSQIQSELIELYIKLGQFNDVGDDAQDWIMGCFTSRFLFLFRPGSSSIRLWSRQTSRTTSLLFFQLVITSCFWPECIKDGITMRR